jgi:hypothetical protein
MGIIADYQAGRKARLLKETIQQIESAGYEVVATKKVTSTVKKTTSTATKKVTPARVKKTRQLLGLSKSQWKRMKRKPGFDPWMPKKTP